MDNSTQIAQLTSIIGQKQEELDILNNVLTLLQTGYQSDKDSIAAQVDEVKKSTTDKLNAIIAGL